jgi:hypothetical protein
MAGQSKAPYGNRRTGPIALTITWVIDGMSVEEAARLCARDVAQFLPVVGGRRPVRVTAKPVDFRREVRR